MGIRAPLTISLLLLTGMAVISVWAWTLIPGAAHIAIHFNGAGQADGFAPKSAALATIPIIGLVVTALFTLLTLAPSRGGRVLIEMPVYIVGWMGTMLALSLVHIGIVMVARGVWINMPANVSFFLALLFVGLGNFLGKTDANDFVGIRTPWTLSSDYSWEKTNRLGGWLLVGIGLAMLGSLACAGPKLAHWVMLGGLLLLIAVALPLSWYYWKQDPNREG